MSSDLQTGTWNILRTLYVIDAPVYNDCITATVAVVKTVFAEMSVMKGSFDVLVLFISEGSQIQKHSSSRFPTLLIKYDFRSLNNKYDFLGNHLYGRLMYGFISCFLCFICAAEEFMTHGTYFSRLL